MHVNLQSVREGHCTGLNPKRIVFVIDLFDGLNEVPEIFFVIAHLQYCVFFSFFHCA